MERSVRASLQIQEIPEGDPSICRDVHLFGSISSVGAQNDRHGSDPTANADVDAVDCELKRMRREADCLRTLRDSVEDE